MLCRHVDVTYRVAGGKHVFVSSDYKILIAHTDVAEAAARFIKLVQALTPEGVAFRVEAYAPLGPALKVLRDAGVICRVGLDHPPPLQPPPYQMPGMATAPPPPPVYASWGDYLGRTSVGERMGRCAGAARRANRKRLLSEMPEARLAGRDVWTVLEAARGRCAHCGSLAVEGRPSDRTTGAPIAWAQIGRRIGSLEHVRWRYGGGDNDFSNLAWACLWCNTWPSERRRFALDHGGYYPAD
jgi:hypothetical protein